MAGVLVVPRVHIVAGVLGLPSKRGLGEVFDAIAVRRVRTVDAVLPVLGVASGTVLWIGSAVLSFVMPVMRARR